MEGIACAYYDQEADYDISQYPDLTAALETFRNFKWDNVEPGSLMKSLYFQAVNDNGSSMIISSLEHGKWTVGATAVNRRRFLGPFFKKNIVQIFLDLDKSATEGLIQKFFTLSLEEFTDFVAKSDPDSAVSIS